MGAFAQSDPQDLLLVSDIHLVKQQTSVITVAFDDAAVADFYDDMVDQGIKPEECGRIWAHSHPGNSAEPSGTDDETFSRCFGSTDWSLMFILARGGQTYARMQFRAGPSGTFQIPVEVAYEQPFQGSDHPAWQAEYERCVHPIQPHIPIELPFLSFVQDPVVYDQRDEWIDTDTYYNLEMHYDEIGF